MFVIQTCVAHTNFVCALQHRGSVLDPGRVTGRAALRVGSAPGVLMLGRSLRSALVTKKYILGRAPLIPNVWHGHWTRIRSR
jgi:hypothetical protein